MIALADKIETRSAARGRANMSVVTMDSDAIRQLVEQAVAAAVGQIMTARATAATTAATGLTPPAFSVNPAGAATTP